jgi:hypothetical protein
VGGTVVLAELVGFFAWVGGLGNGLTGGGMLVQRASSGNIKHLVRIIGKYHLQELVGDGDDESKTYLEP